MMNEKELKEKLAFILGKNVEQVERMEFVKIMEKLVEIVESHEEIIADFKNPHRSCPDCGEDCVGWVSHGERCKRKR